jgi:hypothetical protein
MWFSGFYCDGSEPFWSEGRGQKAEVSLNSIVGHWRGVPALRSCVRRQTAEGRGLPELDSRALARVPALRSCVRRQRAQGRGPYTKYRDERPRRLAEGRGQKAEVLTPSVATNGHVPSGTVVQRRALQFRFYTLVMNCGHLAPNIVVCPAHAGIATNPRWR